MTMTVGLWSIMGHMFRPRHAVSVAGTALPLATRIVDGSLVDNGSLPCHAAISKELELVRVLLWVQATA